jgi:hypothetical protein
MRSVLGSLVAVAVFVCSTGTSFGAAPANDNFAAAQDLGTLPATVAGTTVEATTETGEPTVFTGSGDKTVWFKWTAGASGPVHLDVCGPDGYNRDALRLAVYQGTAFENLEVIAKNSFWANEDCAQTFLIEKDVTYHVAVVSWPDGHAFNLTVRPANPPANDDFANAQTIGPDLPVEFSGTTVDATAEPGEPQHDYHSAPTKSVWYRWVAPRNTEATFDRDCTTDVERTISIYTGTDLNHLQHIVGTVCYVTINVTKGTTYWIAANSMVEGGFQFRITAPTPPANDDFGMAEQLPSGLPSSVLGSIVNATWEDGEPDHFTDLPAYTSVWYRWTATTSGLVRADTCDSDFDSVLAVYSGNSVTGLAPMASSDDDTFCDTEATNPYGSAPVFTAQAGQEYRIAVDGYDVGGFRLAMTAAGPQSGPVVPSITSKARAKKKSCRSKRKRHKKHCRKRRR